MKTESNIKPSAVIVEEHGDNAEVIFRENITEETREQDGENTVVYVYDEYRLNVPNRAGLLKTVKAAKKNWLEAAKSDEYDALAAEIREKRNKLLEATDARMCLDRIGLDIPSGSSFSAWLAFLKGIADAISGEWAKYRQQLRDITKQEGFPYNVEFPKPPEDKTL